ncbi:MAG TPA: pyruvate formate-lyase-activating protein [Humisphaera sp.]|jgi:pyruvate formate lyase activating enzyme|nr:pyruvate formate-lyase-activating protein [Humisphaera sp.]
MTESTPQNNVPLEAKSPYELRVNLSAGVPENAVKHALETGDMGFLHSFTTGSTVDGPGVRVVAWTAGCHWRCQFCHNPDTWSLSNGMPVTLTKAVEEIRKYRHGLKVMSGGFTITGGEPLVQDRFATRLLAAAKQMGVHTALNTNGGFGERVSDQELDSIDLVIMDMKMWDPERHRKLTGKDNAPTHDFARRLSARKQPLWVRFVLIPGVTDDVADIQQIAKFCASLGNVQRVDVLPFHQMGRFKWKELGINYPLENTEPPSNELVQQVCALFAAEGLKTV